MRKIQKYVGMLTAGMLTGMLLTACSTKPEYYSKREVMQYVQDVFGKDYKLTEMLSYPDDSDESTLCYEYVFTNDDDVSFSVYAETGHPGIDDTEMKSVYEKRISDNYRTALLNAHSEELEEFGTENGLDLEFLGEAGDYTGLCLYLDDISQITQAGDFVAEADAILNYEYDYEQAEIGGASNPAQAIAIYLRPNVAVDDSWKSDFSSRLCEVDISHAPTARWTSEDAGSYIERQLTYKVKQSEDSQYTIPDALWMKYPARYIRVTDVGNTDVSAPDAYGNTRFVLCLDAETETYWMNDLDPCQDFGDFPYQYTQKGMFAELVKALGGTYTCDDWRASWTIGNHTWNAELFVDDRNHYQDFKAFCDGKRLSLSMVDESKRQNGTVSGRWFSTADLEQLLHVDIEIDQVTMTAEFLPKR